MRTLEQTRHQLSLIGVTSEQPWIVGWFALQAVVGAFLFSNTPYKVGVRHARISTAGLSHRLGNAIMQRYALKGAPWRLANISPKTKTAGPQ